MNKLRLICRNDHGTHGALKAGHEYEAQRGIEPGIYPDRPYVTVTDENGRATSYHLTRFAVIPGPDSHGA